MSSMAGDSANLALLQRIEELENENKQLKGIVLWENPNPTQSFPAQTIELQDNSVNYAYKEIIFVEQNNSTYQYSTGRISGNARLLSVGSGRIEIRSISFNEATAEVTINTTYSSYAGGASESVNGNIPLKIIGYKS